MIVKYDDWLGWTDKQLFMMIILLCDSVIQ